MAKISWGVISTANIGVEKVIPAMQKGAYTEVKAIASRDLNRAKETAQKLGIPKVYGTYEELLSDKEIQAVYIPLPNHLHVPWTIKSLEAGKHVLCEKPIAMNFEEVLHLQEEVEKFPGLKVMEAFMYRHHPQTLKIKELIDGGTLGDLRNISTLFSYFNDNPQDVRNQSEIGGGGLLDIGCYCISISRFLFGSEPKRVCGSIEYDPKFKIDRLVSAVMEFEKGTAVFSCATQMFYNQFAEIFGTRGRIRAEVPFTPSPDEQAKITLHTNSGTEEITFDACDQYTIQGDLFSKAILENSNLPTPIEDAVANMKVIDGIFESAKKNMWVEI